MENDTAKVSKLSYLIKSIGLSLPFIIVFMAYQNCAKSPERSTSLVLNGADVYNSNHSTMTGGM